VHCEDQQGGGACFVLRLPLQQAQASLDMPSRPMRPATAPSRP
jgi:hypothetical protein